ncbi:hypothetical protein PPERSA_08068 [Pseudocohnilembus persalinus]|uniref:PB1 domain-containing protein n=1 Tax=Pseudocohnilembus persalinus TaxID=266149 RepID=A0A0V0R3H1_PSEPJ|nr:hypothetical protein PPERSA_08068 [Pseudocohnilembus persalinus]|eukprot:KRX08757.1 hypothetical protein PPERSA_08068 [Pseudocohnilembus persalinus]
MTLKVQYKKIIYVYSQEPTYQKLTEFILNSFSIFQNLDDLEIFYLDEDLDEITISCEKDLQCYLECCPQNTKIQVRKAEKSLKMSQVSQADSLLDDLRSLTQSLNSFKSEECYYSQDIKDNLKEQNDDQKNSQKNDLSCSGSEQNITQSTVDKQETQEKQIQCDQQDLNNNENAEYPQQKFSNINFLMQQRLKNAEDVRRKNSEQQLEFFNKNKSEYYSLLKKNSEISTLYQKLQLELKQALPLINEFLEVDFSHDTNVEHNYTDEEQKLLKEINLHKCLKLQQISTICGKNQLMVEQKLKKLRQKNNDQYKNKGQQTSQNKIEQLDQTENSKAIDTQNKFVEITKKVIQQNKNKKQNLPKKGGNIFQKFFKTLTKNVSEKSKKNLQKQKKQKKENKKDENNNKQKKQGKEEINKKESNSSLNLEKQKTQESQEQCQQFDSGKQRQQEQNEEQKQESNELQKEQEQPKESVQEQKLSQENLENQELLQQQQLQQIQEQEQEQKQQQKMLELQQQQQNLELQQQEEQNLEQQQQQQQPQQLSKEEIQKQKQQEQFQFKLKTYGEQLSEVLGGNPEEYYGIIIQYPMEPIEDLIETILENPDNFKNNQI